MESQCINFIYLVTMCMLFVSWFESNYGYVCLWVGLWIKHRHLNWTKNVNIVLYILIGSCVVPARKQLQFNCLTSECHTCLNIKTNFVIIYFLICNNLNMFIVLCNVFPHFSDLNLIISKWLLGRLQYQPLCHCGLLYLVDQKLP